MKWRSISSFSISNACLLLLIVVLDTHLSFLQYPFGFLVNFFLLIILIPNFVFFNPHYIFWKEDLFLGFLYFFPWFCIQNFFFFLVRGFILFGVWIGFSVDWVSLKLNFYGAFSEICGTDDGVGCKWERGKGSLPDGLISCLCNIYGDHYKCLVTQLCYKWVTSSMSNIGYYHLVLITLNTCLLLFHYLLRSSWIWHFTFFLV